MLNIVSLVTRPNSQVICAPCAGWQIVLNANQCDDCNEPSGCLVCRRLFWRLRRKKEVERLLWVYQRQGISSALFSFEGEQVLLVASDPLGKVGVWTSASSIISLGNTD